jgi:myo-inositol-1(or 4)-monophosphatase
LCINPPEGDEGMSEVTPGRGGRSSGKGHPGAIPAGEPPDDSSVGTPGTPPGETLDGLYDTCLETARQAGEFLLGRFNRKDLRVTSVLRHDVKLDVDVDTEGLIKELIGGRYPEHGFICEESGAQVRGGGSSWIVDPLDGTVNFFAGIPHFCTSIALKKNGEYLVGAVYDPVRDEMFSARGDAGAFLNGRPIVRREISDLREALVAGGFFKTQTMEEGARVFQNLSRRVKKIRFLGSAALDLCYLACGRVNVYMQHWLNEWDIAAAQLIALQAGAVVDVIPNRGHLDVLGADVSIIDTVRDLVVR